MNQSLNPFPNGKFKILPNKKSLQTTILRLMKIVESSPNGWKTLWEKQKLLVTSNFSFSHSVFKLLVLQTRKNQGLFGKGLIMNQSLNHEPVSKPLNHEPVSKPLTHEPVSKPLNHEPVSKPLSHEPVSKS